jgi:hypothetical protein
MSDHRSFFYWLPRVLGIAFALFLMLFTFDAWEGTSSFWEGLLGWFIHMLPVFIVLFVLVVAWARPRIGGSLFLLLGAGFAVFFGERWDGQWTDALISFLIISGPLFLLGALFLLESRRIPPQPSLQA